MIHSIHIAYFVGSRSAFYHNLDACVLLWKRGKSTALVFGPASLLPERLEVARVMWLY